MLTLTSLEIKTKKRLQTEERLRFHRITREDIPVLSRYLTAFGSESCDYSIGGILMWTDYFKYEMAEYRSTLFMKGKSLTGNGTLFSLPIGEMALNDSLAELRHYCREEHTDCAVMCCTADRERLCSTSGSDDCEEQPHWRDYLYDINSLATFAGKKMSKKRNHLNAFHALYGDAVVSGITPADADELVAFTQRFEDNRDDNEMGLYEAEATVKVIRHLSDYPFSGIVIRLHGEVIGFTIGEVIGHTLFAHIEKGNTDYRGVYQALCSGYCSLIREKYPEVKFVNREDDAGSEMLMKSKLSYNPVGFVDKYVVRF